MAASYSRLQKQVRDFSWHLDAASPKKPVVILLHGLGGDHNDWRNPFQDRNWPYDHMRKPEERDLGVQTKPPLAELPGIETKYFMSPRLSSNSRGADGCDDRSWWQALVKAG